MIKGRRILSLPVVIQDSRRTIGEVKDIIYDPAKNRILGYLVENGGWLKEGKGFLHRDLVRMENEYVILEDESAVQKISKLSELKDAIEQNKDVRGLRVEYCNGHCVGVIQDLLVDETTGLITGYEISDGIIQDLLDGRTTIPIEEISICKDKVIVSQADSNIT